ncbi:MAG TPA: hypothetical protein VHY56_01295, partial [Candidatus Binataceae bacterium]|nr:hypothetical protein [Candidatus Binataceae bacterium]
MLVWDDRASKAIAFARNRVSTTRHLILILIHLALSLAASHLIIERKPPPPLFAIRSTRSQKFRKPVPAFDLL